MAEAPFIALCDEDGERHVLSVPPGHEGFVRHATGLLRLRPGLHRLACERVAAVFLVRVDGAHSLEMRSLGDAMLRDATGRWRPLKVLGRLAYGVARPEQLVEFLEREQIHDPHELEHELARLAVDLLANVLDGDALQADKISDHLDAVSGELLRGLTAVVLPLGLRLDGLDLLAAPASPAGSTTARSGI